MTQDVSAHPWPSLLDSSSETVVSVIIGDLEHKKRSRGPASLARHVTRPAQNSMVRLAVLNTLRPASSLPRAY
jgi:hypothetical protein